jgi:hypothetical protein
MSNDDVARSKVRLPRSGSASDRSRPLSTAQGRSTEAGSLTCMTTATDWPREWSREDRERSGNKGVLKRRNRLLTDPFQRVLAVGQSGLHRIPKPRADARLLPTKAGISGSGTTPWERTSWIDPTRTQPTPGDQSATRDRTTARPRRSETATTPMTRSEPRLEEAPSATYRMVPHLVTRHKVST